MILKNMKNEIENQSNQPPFLILQPKNKNNVSLIYRLIWLNRKVKWETVVEGDTKVPFSITSTLTCPGR